MSIPNWYSLILLALAAFRTWKLLGEDTVLDWPRNRSIELAFRLRGPKGKQTWQDFLECPYCLGFWCALAWWGAFQLWEHGTLVASVPMAISALVCVVAWVISE